MIAWDDYARTYDLMAEHNPAYQELLAIFANVATGWPMAEGEQIIEFGAGTGNFAIRAAELHPRAVVVHSEPEPTMQQRARDKAAERGCGNVCFTASRAEDAEFAAETFSGAILVHVLYTLPAPHEFMRHLHRWMRRGAPIFACDLGRILEVAEWRRYLVGEMSRTVGWWKTLCLLWRGRGVVRANRAIAAAQRSGRYWLHDATTFASAFREAGFTVDRQSTAYRGYSDLILARA